MVRLNCCQAPDEVDTNEGTVCRSCNKCLQPLYESGWCEGRTADTKTVHDLRRWMQLCIEKHELARIPARAVIDDFCRVVDVMREGGMLDGRNVSSYEFYLLRLCSLRWPAVGEKVPDLKTKKTREAFEDRLFGRVYPKLHLAADPNNCKYYKEWLSRWCEQWCYRSSAAAPQ